MNRVLLITWMHAPVFSLQRQQIRAHLLLGIWDTLVIGSIFSGFPMLTCTEGLTHKEDTSCSNVSAHGVDKCKHMQSGLRHSVTAMCVKMVTNILNKWDQNLRLLTRQAAVRSSQSEEEWRLLESHNDHLIKNRNYDWSSPLESTRHSWRGPT